MKITIYKYVAKEETVYLAICVLGLSFVLLTGRLMQLTRYLFTTTVTTGDLAILIGLAMPKLLFYALPMAALVGILLAFLRLNTDNELVALRASGVSMSETFPAVLGVLIPLAFLAYLNAIWVMPYSNQGFEDRLKSLGRANLNVLLKEGTFIDFVPNLVFFFNSVNTSNLSINGVFVHDSRQGDVRLAIVAEKAQLLYRRDLGSLTFKISNGIITRTAENLKDAQSVSFRVYDLTLSLDEVFGTGSKSSRGRSQMTLDQLSAAIGARGGKRDNHYATELHQRLALPLSCVLLGLLGMPLGALFRNAGKMFGITTGLSAFLVYYILLSAGKSLGENGVVPPALAMWFPNVVTLGVAIYLWHLIHKEKTPKIWLKAWKVVSAAGNKLRRPASVQSH